MINFLSVYLLSSSHKNYQTNLHENVITDVSAAQSASPVYVIEPVNGWCATLPWNQERCVQCIWGTLYCLFWQCPERPSVFTGC